MRGARYRVVMGLVVLIALAVQWGVRSSIPEADRVQFFSFFTTLSNILGALLFIYCGLQGAQQTRAVDMARGAATVYLATTGIVYNLLLASEPGSVTKPWVNTVLHSVMPIAAVVDWLVNPPAHRLTFRRTWVWLLFPVAFVVYSMIRGAVTGWYPYPFLNPDRAGGYAGVAAYCVGIALFLAGLVFAVTWIGNRQHDRMTQASADAAGKDVGLASGP